MKTAVIIGSTGLTGALLIEKLAQDGVFGQIIAICRSKPPARGGFSNPKVRVLNFNFLQWSELELQVKSFIGTSQSSFFCCLGTTLSKAGSEEAFKKVDHDYAVEFARLAKSCRAEQLLVVSALGADKNSSVFYNRVKGEMEASVQSTFSGKLHFLRPSLLLGERSEFRLGERLAIIFSPLYSSLMVGSLQKYRPVPAAAVSEALLRLATKKLNASIIVTNEEILRINEQEVQ